MKIHLKKKKLNSGKYSLYIEYYRGHTLDEKGKTKHLREFAPNMLKVSIA